MSLDLPSSSTQLLLLYSLFFRVQLAVPPSMTSPRYSNPLTLQQQQIPNRLPSYDNIRSASHSRLKLNSISSPRPLISSDTLSPSLQPPAAYAPIQLASVKPQDRPSITFKILHPTTNLVLKIQRDGISLEGLRNQIERKFLALSPLASLSADSSDNSGIKPDREWEIIHANSIEENEGNGAINTEEQFQALLIKTLCYEKVAPKIV